MKNETCAFEQKESDLAPFAFAPTQFLNGNKAYMN